MHRISLLWWTVIVAAALLAGMTASAVAEKRAAGKRSGRMVTGTAIKLESPAFAEGGMIPLKYSCDGEDMSPPLRWNVAPAGTKSYTLLVEDPDASSGLWVHWVVYNIPPEAKEFPEGVSSARHLPKGTMEGMTDNRKTTYGGPCPPPGTTHRYFFRLYALDTPLALQPGGSRKQVLDAMKGHILAEGELMGKYARRR